MIEFLREAQMHALARAYELDQEANTLAAECGGEITATAFQRLGAEWMRLAGAVCGEAAEAAIKVSGWGRGCGE